jgi:signal transduction histidine kinase
MTTMKKRRAAGRYGMRAACALFKRERALFQRERALRLAQAALARMTQLVTVAELATAMAHEVNQPLTAIAANGEACLRWIDRPVPNLDEAQAAVERMLAAGRRASALLRHIRQHARRRAPEHAPVDLAVLVVQTVQLLQRELCVNGATLATTVEVRLPRVTGDAVQLQQVLINLLMNGLEAMRGNGAGMSRALAVTVSATVATAAAGTVTIGVRDTGPGVAADLAARMFDAFTTTRDDAIGMGLTICRAIVEAHGGRIWQDTAPETGACFVFTLPVAAGEAR